MTATNNWNPKICVVLPTYNASNHIETALVSIQSQNYHHYDVIIADNVSDDNTLAIVKRVMPHASIICRRDVGIPDALNHAFDSANADIFCWLNSDDEYFDRNVFSQVADAFRKNPNAYWLYGNSLYRSPSKLAGSIIVAHTPFLSGRSLNLNIFTGSMFFTARAWRDFTKFDTKYSYAFEYQLIKFLKEYRSVRIKKILGVFNYSTNSLSFKHQKKMNAEALEIDICYNTKPYWYYVVRLFEHIFFK